MAYLFIDAISSYLKLKPPPTARVRR